MELWVEESGVETVMALLLVLLLVSSLVVEELGSALDLG